VVETGLAAPGIEMAKKKNEESETKKLEKQIRELKSKNRNLLKRLKKVDKNYKEVFEELEEDNEEEQQEATPKRTCRECGRGEITEVNILGRIFRRCELCGWRSKVEKS
jgi:predicted transcriptional regulator